MTRLNIWWGRLAEVGRMMVGQGNYEAYRQHMAQNHPGAEVMNERSFFRHRQLARSRGKSGGKCC
jgi:uncharacterized short protein YbdD (DUF466 family)